MDWLRLAVLAFSVITVVANVVTAIYLVRTNRELRQIRDREAARRMEHFWRASEGQVIALAPHLERREH